MSLPEATATVVIPCYNGAADLPAAVASVLAQTFQDYRLVLVDDASTDETPRVMRRLAEGNPRISVVRLAENRGRAAARNRGAQATRGPYLAFLDHDDTYHPDFLRQTVAVLSSLPQFDRVKVLPRISIELDPLRYAAVKNSLVTTSLVRREAFDFIGGWPESAVFKSHVHAGEDVAFELLFAACFDTAWLSQELYNYTHRPGNSLDRFLARSKVEGGKLISTGEAAEQDQALANEVARLKRLLRTRVRALSLDHGRQHGLERLEDG
jgi:glycosyltransferase involved in cell wall biosynthesis